MFVRKVANPNMKAAENPAGKLAPQASAPAARPGRGTVEPMVTRQGSIGNQVMLRRLAQHSDNFTPQRSSPAAATSPDGVTVQAKLVGGQANDPLEHEADRVAEQVLAMGDTALATRDGPLPTVQQGGQAAKPRSAGYVIQRQPAATPAPAPASDPLTAPLTESDWRGVDLWLAQGVVGASPLTGDSDHNADLIAGAIFCERRVGTPEFGTGDPLLCLVPDVTAAEPRVQTLKRNVLARGPLINWPAVPANNRLVYVMERLVQVHHYPVNGAAGIAGNVFAESGALPSRVEGSAAETPLRSANFAGQQTDFRPEDVENRNGGTTPPVGPQKPGVGLAQWTSGSRRSGLFQQTAPDGRQLGSSILFNMDAQVDYLVAELQANTGLNGSLTNAGVAVDTASDDVVYNFEIPASVLDASGGKRPRTDPQVVTEFTARRGLAHKALQAYQAAHHGP